MEKNIHYYTKNDNLDSNVKKFDITLFEQKFTFTTDNGVFSKSYLDFGTRLLLENFVCPDCLGKYLDVGCGYGPIGIAISKIYKKEVLMLDINDRAVKLANINANLNSCSATAIQLDITEGMSNQEQFACVISNPPIRAGKKVIYSIYESAYGQLLENGELWIVIQKKQGAPSTITKLESIFHNTSVVCKKNGYYIIKCIKKSLD